MVWKYKDTFIINGSTLVDDIDLRLYYHIETNAVDEQQHHSKTDGSNEGVGMGSIIIGGGAVVRKKSELFLSSTSVDDNGTFACIASNAAGVARANFTLHVVVPMPPKPPQVRANIKYVDSNLMECGIA